MNVNPLFQPPELESCLRLSDAEAIILNEIADEHVLYDVLAKVIPEIDEFDHNKHIQTKKLPMLRTVITTSHQSRKYLLNSDSIHLTYISSVSSKDGTRNLLRGELFTLFKKINSLQRSNSLTPQLHKN